jgi:hypothetical protein
MMKRSDKPYVNRKTLVEYVKSIFIPHIIKVYVEEKMEEEKAVFLMHNCPSHIILELIDLLTSLGMMGATFAPNTTHIFQVLDLTRFGIFKLEGKYNLPFDKFRTTITFVCNLCIKMTMMLVHPSIWTVFQAIDIDFHTSKTPDRVGVHVEKLQKSPGFVGSRDTDLPLASLTTLRQNARFGW